MTVSESQLRDPNLPKRLRNARRDRGLTQEQVASDLGLSRTSMVALEKGERGVQPTELVALARMYGRPLDELLRPTPPVEDFVGQFRTSLSRSADNEQLEAVIREVERYADASLVEVALETGRTHQIRVHAHHIGHALAGDEKYGDRAFNKTMRERGLKRLFLHAARFQFEIGERSYAFSAPLAPELAAVLDTLKEGNE